MTLAHIAKNLERFTSNHSPLILTSIGVAGTISTALLTGKATIKAVELTRFDFDEEPYTRKEVVQKVWKLYIPAASTGAVTIGCIVLANRIGTRRAAAMAAAYTISERAFEEYREKIIEKVGANEERKARDEIAQERADRHPVKSTEVLITDGGNVLCFDQYSSRYFMATMEKIKKAQNDTNYEMINHDYASLNSFYDRCGLDHVKFGDDVGWTAMEKLEVMFTTIMSTDDRPCIAIDFRVEPVRDYFRSH